MIKLNLTAENDCHKAIKDYLEHNTSSNLAEKINNGVKVEKDGKTLINKKTLSGFWSYASKKAQEQKTGYVANETVFGWAIHYFEENDIIGTLYNEDGSEYEPISKPIQRIPAPIVPAKPTPPKPAQASLFDFLANAETPSNNEPTEENIETPVEELNKRDEPTELEVDMETGEILTPILPERKPNSLYQRYLDVEKQYPHAVVAYRLGDFYEIFRDNAVLIAKELELTLTGRDCGLVERVPMVGFPYHASDNYFRKIRTRHKLVIIDDGEVQVLEKLSFEQEKTKSIPTPPPAPEYDYDEGLEDLREQTKHIDKDALCLLLELFDYELDVQ